MRGCFRFMKKGTEKFSLAPGIAAIIGVILMLIGIAMVTPLITALLKSNPRYEQLQDSPSAVDYPVLLQTPMPYIGLALIVVGAILNNVARRMKSSAE